MTFKKCGSFSWLLSLATLCFTMGIRAEPLKTRNVFLIICT